MTLVLKKSDQRDGRSSMQSSRRRNGNHSTIGLSHGIMYQSRMRYLRSRDGTCSSSSTTKTKLAERGKRSQLPFSSLLGAKRTPCVAEKLLPPTELMTRERSLRRAYWKHHPPVVPLKMKFLEKKEDPVLNRKRDAIFARIKAKELLSERLKREKESWKRVKQQRSGGGGGGEGPVIVNNNSSPDLLESSYHEDVQDGSGMEPLSRPRTKQGSGFQSSEDILGEFCRPRTKQGSGFQSSEDILGEFCGPRTKQGSGFQSSEDILGEFSGFVSDGCKKDPSSTASCNSGGDDINDDDNFGDSFAFLADWNKKTKLKSYKRPRRQRNMQNL